VGDVSETIWPYDNPRGGYHDTDRCKCDGHCRNCWTDLAESREVIAAMIADGRAPESWRLGPRVQYCSAYCRNRAKRERALDRALSRYQVSE